MLTQSQQSPLLRHGMGTLLSLGRYVRELRPTQMPGQTQPHLTQEHPSQAAKLWWASPTVFLHMHVARAVAKLHWLSLLLLLHVPAPRASKQLLSQLLLHLQLPAAHSCPCCCCCAELVSIVPACATVVLQLLLLQLRVPALAAAVPLLLLHVLQNCILQSTQMSFTLRLPLPPLPLQIVACGVYCRSCCRLHSLQSNHALASCCQEPKEAQGHQLLLRQLLHQLLHQLP